MYAVFVLICDKTLLALPVTRCAYLDVVRCCNHGLNRNLKRRIFFSSDKFKEPNYKLPLGNMFDSDRDGCYLAYCLKFFANDTEANAFIETQRRKYPACYNDRNLREVAPPAFTVLPPDVKQMVQAELKPFQQAFFYANSLIGIQDLTDDDVADLGDILMMPDDDDSDQDNEEVDHDEEDNELIEFVNTIQNGSNDLVVSTTSDNEVRPIEQAGSSDAVAKVCRGNFEQRFDKF